MCTEECRGYFNQVMANYGVEFSYVDTSDPDDGEERDSPEHAHRLD